MSRFTVRVQLRDSADADYDELHEKMESNGFSRTLPIELGPVFLLPDAEYNYVSDSINREGVARLAFSVAESVKIKPKILVTQSKGRFVLGLDEV